MTFLGLVTVALMGAWIGGYNCLQKRYALESFLELSAEINATAFRILPTIAVAIAKQTQFDLSRLSNINTIMCTGAALPPSIISFFREKLSGAPIVQGYGMTECNITLLKAESAHHVGSVGKLCANTEARIVDDDGKDVAPGEPGEILVRGPQVFNRYMRNEEGTKETFDGEWLKTGDVGRIDKDGYWWLTERKKELIKYKGYGSRAVSRFPYHKADKCIGTKSHPLSLKPSSTRISMLEKELFAHFGMKTKALRFQSRMLRSLRQRRSRVKIKALFCPTYANMSILRLHRTRSFVEA